jgi:hypothetical protein
MINKELGEFLIRKALVIVTQYLQLAIFWLLENSFPRWRFKFDRSVLRFFL